MSGGIIAIIIMVLALIVLIVFGLTISKKVSHLINEINKTTNAAQDKVEFFTRDIDSIKLKVSQITNRTNEMTREMNKKMKKVNYFSETTTDFQDALDELQLSIEQLFSRIFNFSGKQSNPHKPTISILKKTAKKLLQKQKMI